MDTPANINTAEIKSALEKERLVLYNSFMHAPAAIALFKGNTFISEFANIEYERITSRKIIVGKTVQELFPEIEQQGLIAILNNVFSSGEPFIANEFPIELINNTNGELALGYYNLVIQPIKDEHGNTERLMSHTIEVTQQVEARKIIQASEERYRSLFETMEQGFCIIELIFDNKNNPLDYIFIEANPVFKKQFGIVNPVGKTIRALVPNIEERWIQIYGKIALLGEPNHFIDYNEELSRWFEVSAFRLGENGSKKVAVLFTNITERKQNEETLRYSNALLEAHNEANRDGLLLVDINGKIISYNKSFIDIWYMPKEIVESKDDKLALEFAMSQLVNPQQFIDKVKWLYAHPSETSIDELEYLDGRIIERHGYSVLGEDGTYYAWAWTFRDITGQKAAAKAIIESEKQFRTFADSIQSLAWIANGDGWIYWYNQRWFAYTGTTLEEMQGWGWEKVHHPEHINRVLSFVTKAWKKDEPFELTFPLRRHDGEYRWFLTRAYPIKDTNGNIEKWIGTNTDITENKNFTEELEIKVEERTAELVEKEDYLNQIIRNAPDAVIVINENSIITLWNPKAEEIFGWKAEEVVGLHLSDTIVPPQYREGHKEGMKRFIETGEARILNITLNLTALNNQGKEFPISITISKASKQGNKFFIAFLRDITLENHNKEQLYIKSKQLEDINQTLELNNRELEFVNAELASFNYVASHDLKEPLRKIQLFSRLIIDTENFTGKTQDYFNRVISATERMQNLIDSLLDFSRASMTELLFTPCDLNEVVEESKNDLSLTISENKATIEYHNLPTITGVHILLTQLFTNLIDNAIKYSRPEIKPHITITASLISGSNIAHKAANQQKEYHAIKMADNGIGFENEYATKIFELFQRLHNKNEYSGTGIGLAIVKKIVTNHNGFIIAESIPNSGATFTIYLPKL